MMPGLAWGKLKSNLVFISEMGACSVVSPQRDKWKRKMEDGSGGRQVGAGGWPVLQVIGKQRAQHWCWRAGFPSSQGCAEWASPTKCYMLVFQGTELSFVQCT